MPEGAFYVMPSFKRLLGGRAATSADVARLLLKEKAVVVTAGSAFGVEGFIRISYANSLEMIREGVKRIAELAHELNNNMN
jgi:aspartate aminotransferase